MSRPARSEGPREDAGGRAPPLACRLYLITPPQTDDAFAAALEGALDAGDVAALQIRLKGHVDPETGEPAPADDAVIRAQAPRLIEIAQARGVMAILNDRPDLAGELGADGVHVGQSDASYAEARALLGERAVIGVTCHNSRHLAMEAAEAGADYVAFGAFHPSGTKAAKHRADPEILEWWSEIFTTPAVAIGGVTAQTAAALAAAGADYLAVSSGVWAHGEGPAAGVRALNEAIAQGCAARARG